jgi:GR25 family glycosyltransferase involved in LPS biosynthesis
MNVYATVVKNRISTALVMEDDADWDVSLKHQLQNFAVGSQHILYGEHTQSFNSPYGDEWDLLWLGHCGSAPGHHDSRRHVLENDPTVPPIERRVNEVDTPDMTEFSNNTRIVYAASSGFCMYGYAVSYHGAQKLLHHLSLHPYHEAVDLSINRLCGNSSYSFTCVSVFPQLFNSHRAAGSISGDTDIGDLSELKDTIRKKSYTHNIVYSTRLNMGRLVKGCETAQSQWPDDTR